MKPAEAERRARFLLEARALGFRDLSLLRAMERAPRALFLAQRYEDLAWRDLALPIPCGQSATPPYAVAAMIEALEPRPEHRVLEIGVGTGYSTALLAQCAGEVVGLERAEPLAAEAAARLRALGLDNVDLRWADGLAPPPLGGKFDRILVGALLPPLGGPIDALLAPGGRIVGAGKNMDGGQFIALRDARGERAGAAGRPAVRGFSALIPGLIRAI